MRWISIIVGSWGVNHFDSTGRSKHRPNKKVVILPKFRNYKASKLQRKTVETLTKTFFAKTHLPKTRRNPSVPKTPRHQLPTVTQFHHVSICFTHVSPGGPVRRQPYLSPSHDSNGDAKFRQFRTIIHRCYKKMKNPKHFWFFLNMT